MAKKANPISKNTEKLDNKKSSSLVGWLLWWKIDEDELNKQVSEYNSLNIFKSARGISLLLLLFSSAITVLFVQIAEMGSLAYIDAIIMATLGVFVYYGHKWATLAAMVLWTIEKAFMLGSGSPIMQIIFWVIYMHAFYLAYRVEKERAPTTNKKRD